MDEEHCICANCVHDKYIRKLISTKGNTLCFLKSLPFLALGSEYTY